MFFYLYKLKMIVTTKENILRTVYYICWWQKISKISNNGELLWSLGCLPPVVYNSLILNIFLKQPNSPCRYLVQQCLVAIDLLRFFLDLKCSNHCPGVKPGPRDKLTQSGLKWFYIDIYEYICILSTWTLYIWNVPFSCDPFSDHGPIL